MVASGGTINPFGLLLHAIWSMVCTILGVAHLSPRMAGIGLAVILTIAISAQVRTAIQGSKAWSIDDPKEGGK